jgi:hypothetical protein
MTLETRFLQIFGYKILSLNFVQNDDGAFHSDSDAVQ